MSDNGVFKDANLFSLNKYLLSIMETHLNIKEYDVLRMSYGLDCDKMSAKEIAAKLTPVRKSSLLTVVGF